MASVKQIKACRKARAAKTKYAKLREEYALAKKIIKKTKKPTKKPSSLQSDARKIAARAKKDLAALMRESKPKSKQFRGPGRPKKVTGPKSMKMLQKKLKAENEARVIAEIRAQSEAPWHQRAHKRIKGIFESMHEWTKE
jgi:hypothetical protein